MLGVMEAGGKGLGSREAGCKEQKSPKAEKPEGLTSEEVSYIKGDNRFVRRIR
jgi:hypothetical protein